MNKDELELYHESIEELFKGKGISSSELWKIIKDKIQKKTMSSFNIFKFSRFINVSRTTFYYEQKSKIIKEKIKINNKLINWILEQGKLSGNVVGRTKMYLQFINLFNNDKKFRRHFKEYNNITEYEFRLSYEASKYKSQAYIKGKQKLPKEHKYSDVWVNNEIKNIVDLKFGTVWTEDIKYIKIQNKYYYLHVIRDHKTNMILNWNLQDTRTANDTISLLKSCIKKYNIKPNYFHTDHGPEYFNFNFKNYIVKNKIIRSTSVKGNSLENHGSEYLFANLKRKIKLMSFNKLNYLEISKYFIYYNYARLQKNRL
ncbi:DDE-type integrase/transposase/recombinase [Mycoplasma sp. CSL7503-lung]|uniref:DDE-type integrase/transposase/recombinase n=1 Tax=Mycoplasma sp. CSL7503-lung TaxID=536372 RepID=UPI0021CE89B4|nr:DDE-type integrase/transposase/recombinase [Mycoplasma sp. CSL7503-lung]MCU4706358.1 DDE-type integrase/transposase/recombinase [Mycoplasma sp. CSL7503-lung]